MIRRLNLPLSLTIPTDIDTGSTLGHSLWDAAALDKTCDVLCNPCSVLVNLNDWEENIILWCWFRRLTLDLLRQWHPAAVSQRFLYITGQGGSIR